MLLHGGPGVGVGLGAVVGFAGFGGSFCPGCVPGFTIGGGDAVPAGAGVLCAKAGALAAAASVKANAKDRRRFMDAALQRIVFCSFELCC
jgi:hypothetical protein